MDSARRREHRPPRCHRGTSIRVAVRNWLTVRSGVFSPVLQTELGQELETDAGQNQMPTNGEILADLEVVHTQLSFAILEQP